MPHRPKKKKMAPVIDMRAPTDNGKNKYPVTLKHVMMSAGTLNSEKTAKATRAENIHTTRDNPTALDCSCSQELSQMSHRLNCRST